MTEGKSELSLFNVMAYVPEPNEATRAYLADQGCPVRQRGEDWLMVATVKAYGYHDATIRVFRILERTGLIDDVEIDFETTRAS